MITRLLSLFCLFSLVACASSQQKEAGVFKENKRRLSFEAEVKIPTQKKRLLDLNNKIFVVVEAKKKTPTEASLLLENFTKSHFSRDCQEAKLFADGAPVPLNSLKRSAARDGFSDAFSATIPASGLAQLAQTNTLTGEMCGIVFSLSESQAASLRQMTSALSAPSQAMTAAQYLNE